MREWRRLGRLTIGPAVLCGLGMSCSSSSSSIDPGSAGAAAGGLGNADPGLGGSSSGTGGFASGTGGFASGTGGSASGTGGSASGTGGFATSAGGSVTGTGGFASGAGGFATSAGGSVIGTGGFASGAGGSGSGGRTFGSGGAGSGVGGAGSSAGGSGSASGGASGSGDGGSSPATGGTGNSGNPTACAITADLSLSSAIPTVGIATWSTNLANLDSAEIQFGLVETGPTMTAPVDLDAPDFRTLLLGMKGQRDYVVRIVAQGGGMTCTSEDYTLTTGAVANSVPVIDRNVINEGAIAKGFIVTSGGVGNFGFGPAVPAFIIDSDGDVVWWADAPTSTSRARMSWEGDAMWMMELNVENGGGEVRRVSMDGLDVQPNVSGLSGGHHDFTVAPGGVIAVIAWQGGCSAILERTPDGTVTPILPDVSNVYQTDRDCHTNAINYSPYDDTYTLSDRNVNLFVKISREGELIWQFGGTNPRGNHFTGSWSVNHGHHLQENGNFLFFNNGSMGAASAVLEFHLDEASWTATPVWEYRASPSSGTLGDAQRLPNGNTLVTYSNQGVLHEVDANGNLIQSFTTSSLGYAEFRESLYGPPTR